MNEKEKKVTNLFYTYTQILHARIHSQTVWVPLTHHCIKKKKEEEAEAEERPYDEFRCMRVVVYGSGNSCILLNQFIHRPGDYIPILDRIPRTMWQCKMSSKVHVCQSLPIFPFVLLFFFSSSNIIFLLSCSSADLEAVCLRLKSIPDWLFTEKRPSCHIQYVFLPK